jgi:hypothetical protein
MLKLHDAKDQDDYEMLIVSAEAGTECLNLLLAVSENNDYRERIISNCEAELEPDFRHYRLVLPREEPSMRQALEDLVEKESYLQQGGKAIINVTGAECLRSEKLPDEERSERQIFAGYLQWTREGLRAFPFSIVLWITPEIEIFIRHKAPDFWSWRRGVFRFGVHDSPYYQEE